MNHPNTASIGKDSLDEVVATHEFGIERTDVETGEIIRDPLLTIELVRSSVNDSMTTVGYTPKYAANYKNAFGSNN